MSESKRKSSKKTTDETKEVKSLKKTTKKETTRNKTVKKEEVALPKTKKVAVSKKSKEHKEGLLTKKEQKAFRIMSKVISIIAKIIRVCMMIAVPILLTVMIIIPILFKNVEFNGNIIRVNDARFVLGNESITLNIEDENYLVADGIKDMNKVINFFNNNSIARITTNILLSIAFVVVIIIINIYIFQHIERLFTNFYKKDTPFENDNCDYLHKIGRLMIISFVATLIFSLVLNLVFRNDMLLNVSSYSLMEILGVYVCYFIFLYGTKMQQKIDTVIYDKEI